MALDPEVIPLLARLEQEGFPDFETSSLEDLRAASVFPPADPPTPVGAIDERSVPGPGGAITVRLYVPEGPGPHPLVMFFHGGGWVVGNLDSHDETVRRLCAGSGAAFASVAYRLAPEAPFPAALEDCYAATAWAAEVAPTLGFDPARIAVAGDSAGGNLAAALCLLARDRGGPALCHQVLVYPVAGADLDTESYRRHGEGLFLTRNMMRWFRDQYLPTAADRENPLAAPLAGDATGLPGATILTAEYDPLRDDGAAYARHLEAAGVAVAYRDFPGMIHGFLGMTGVLGQADTAQAWLCARLREAFSA
ncbi:MAG: alpha/beta hydrolase [Pseudohaliea sp.]